MGSKAYGKYKLETSTPLVSFASLGAKNYSYDTEDGERELKVRGVDLAREASKEIINGEVMYRMLNKFLEGEKEEVKCKNFRMKIDRKKASVKNSHVEKKYSNSVFDKRIVMCRVTGIDDPHENACTLPFGLKHYNFTDCAKEDVFGR